MRPRHLTRLGQCVYPDPRAYDTLEEWERAQHRDLDTLAPDEMKRELGLLRLRLLLDEEPSEWALERARRLEWRLRARPTDRGHRPR